MTDKEIISSQSQQINLLKEKVLSSEEKAFSLEEKVIPLLEQLHKLGIKKDSSNSSLAPSTDTFKKNQSLRVKSKLKSGGQLGHKGHTLKMSSRPDKFCVMCSVMDTLVKRNLEVIYHLNQIVKLQLE